MPVNFVKISIGSKRPPLLAIAVVSVMAALLAVSIFVVKRSSAHGANPAGKKQQGCCPGQQTTQVLYAPTTGLPGAGRAELVLNNNRQDDLAITPTLYTKDGYAVVCDQITLKPSEVRRIPVAELAKGSVQGVGNAGGISLSYFGGDRELRSQIALFGEGRAGSVDIPVTAARDYKSTIQEAVWWSPDGATATLALGNASDSLILVKLVFGGGAQQEILIGPFATETITYKSRNSTPSGAAESVRLEVSGAIGSLRAAGYVRSANKDFTSMIRFYDPQTVRQPNLYATNLRLKNSVPHVVLKNISNEPITATPKFLPLEGSAGNPLELPPVSLAAQEAREVDLAPLMKAAAERDDFEMVSVQVSNSGPTASLIGALCSIDKANSITYEAPLRDSGPMRRSTGTYPWRVDEDYSTLITITNTGQKKAMLAAVISYEGGQYVPDPQTVEAGATAVFDLNKLQREQIPDRDGQTIPQSVAGGQFVWSATNGSNENKLIGRMQLVSKANRASMSFSCELCCPWSFESARVSPDSVNVVVGAGAGVEAQERYYTNCNGQYWLSPWYTACDFTNGEWQSGDPAIATVSPTNVPPTTVTGVAGGTTSVTVSWEAKEWFFSTSFDDCDWFPAPAVANANVQVWDFTVAHNKSAAGVRPSGIIAGINGADPPIPVADTQATVTVSTTPPTSGLNVTLSVVAEEGGHLTVGGHIDHIGVRPVGTLGQTSGTTGQNGTFTTAYTAPQFSGVHRIRATINGVTKEVGIGVFIDGLQELPNGSNYDRVGQTATHPFNHWGTATAVAKLPLIANDYKAMFPGAANLRFNDMSLVSGGKFEIPGNWSTSASHAEHRVGRNCDISSSNVPTNRWAALNQIFFNNNVISVNDETTCCTHWHVRF